MQILPSSESKILDLFEQTGGDSSDTGAWSNSFADFMNIYAGIARDRAQRQELPAPTLEADAGSGLSSAEAAASALPPVQTGTMEQPRASAHPPVQTGESFVERHQLSQGIGLSEQRVEGAAQTLKESASADAAASSTAKVSLQPEDIKTPRLNVHLQEMRLTRDDFDQMTTGLKRFGLSDKDIKELSAKVGSEEGLTWGQFVRFLTERMRASTQDVKIPTAQLPELSSFFQKLGFTPDQSKDMVGSLSRGNAAPVLEAVSAKLKTLPQNEVIGLTPREVTTFMSVLKRAALSGLNAASTDKKTSAAVAALSQDLVKAVETAFAQGATPGGLRQALTMLKNEVAQQAGAQSEKESKLVQLVGDTLNKAARRENLWKGDDRDARRQQVLIRDAVGVLKDIKESVRAQVEVRNPLKKEEGSVAQGKVAAAAVEPKEPAAMLRREVEPRAQERPAPTQNQTSDALSRAVQAKAESAAPQPQPQQQRQNGSEQDNAWREFFGKLRTDLKAEVKAETARSSEFNLAEGLSLGKASQAQSQTQAQASQTLRQALSQVQNGILKTLGQGRTQLNLQLKPEELGGLSVMLQIKNKDVVAVIRAENQETGRMLAANLESIRQSIEEQGLKVSRIEVQTGLAGNEDHAAAQSFEDHNLAREREAAAALRHRWRLLRDEGDELAQEMLNDGQSAILAEQGLHVIA